ncbi:uncharacterized protein [Antedon mediterranea]|uniref:uncharacterized protein isoform X1 n=1 Tax=Antedon mediterranea TaxID=105859 RepID=UPI003AF40EBC
MGYCRLIGNTAVLLQIICYTINAQNSGDVRLQGGSNIFEGRIEIYDTTEWKTVCLDNFNIVDADVVCQQLFKQSAISVVDGSQFGAGTSDDSLTGVACSDTDTTLLDCSNSGYSNACSNHAGANCQVFGYFGCYSNAVVMPLQGPLLTGKVDLTISSCIESCRTRGYVYAGPINGDRCSCGNTIETPHVEENLVSEIFCNVACSGDSTQICGGDVYTSIYTSSIGQFDGTYTQPEGFVYSPNFPSSYLGESTSWMLTFENPTITTVTIWMFDVSENATLVLTSGTGTRQSYSGSESLILPHVWTTDLTSSLEIRIGSTTTPEISNGFVITYEAVTGSCGGDFGGTLGYIASPDYPEDVPSSSATCTYTITAPDNYIIIVELLQRSLPSGSSLVLVDDGVINSVTTIGTFAPSTTNMVSVTFVPSALSPSSFLIKYTASQGPCDAFPTIPFGTLDPSVTGTVYRPTTVSFTCDDGYSSSDSSITCMEDGSWTSAECIVNCDALPTIMSGSVITGGDTVFNPGEQLNVSCDDGYTASVSMITCLNDNSWTTVQCIVNCDALPTIMSGSVITGGDTVFNPGAQLNVSCDNGYTASASMITCLNDNSWTTVQCIEDPPTTTESTTTAIDATTQAVTTAPDVSTAAPDVSTASPDVSTAAPDASTGTPDARTVAPDAGTTSPDVDTVTTKTITTDSPSTTAAGNQPTEDADSTTEGSTTVKSTNGSEQTSDLCRVSRDPIMQSLDTVESANILALNVGNPLDCEGYLTGIEIFSIDTSTVTISVLRFLETNNYQLIGRFDVIGVTSDVVKHSLLTDEYIRFESGDMIATSSRTSSPLTYSTDDDSVDYMIWNITGNDVFHTTEVGNVIRLTSTDDRPKRTYSWAVFITANLTTCSKPDIDNAMITPDMEVYQYQDTIEVECNDGYTPDSVTSLQCLASGSFESFECTVKDRHTFFIIFGIVCVGVFGLLTVISLIMMVCVKEKAPVRAKQKRSTFVSNGSSRSDNSQRMLIPIEYDNARGKGVAVSNPIPIADENPAQLNDLQYPPIDYPLDDVNEAIQAIDEAVLGFDVDNFSLAESGPMDNRSGGDSTRHHVTFSDRR